MSYRSIAYKVLKERDENLSVGNIIDIALEENLLIQKSSDLRASMATALHRDVKREEKSKLILVKRGRFGLREWFYDLNEGKIIDHSIKKGYGEANQKPLLYSWSMNENTVIAHYREDDPYHHYCSSEHFLTIGLIAVDILRNESSVNTRKLRIALEGRNISIDRKFRGKSEVYKLNMVLYILEYEKVVKRIKGSHPYNFISVVNLEIFESWFKNKFAISTDE